MVSLGYYSSKDFYVLMGEKGISYSLQGLFSTLLGSYYIKCFFCRIAGSAIQLFNILKTFFLILAVLRGHSYIDKVQLKHQT